MLSPYAFIRLNEIAVESFYEIASYNMRLGHKLLIYDGSRLLLPNYPSIIKEFGQHSFCTNEDSIRSMALSSILYDPLNLITIDAQMDKYSSSERDLLIKHIYKTKASELLLLDKGYPCI